MRLIFFVFIFLVCGSKCSGAVELRPYVGVDYVASHFDVDNKYKYWKISYSSLNFNTGVYLSYDVGFELFYQDLGREVDKQASAIFNESKYHFKAYGLDVAKYFPVLEKTKIYSSIGIGKYQLNSKDEYRLNHKENLNGYRVGLGLQNDFFEKVSLRFSIRYIFMETNKFNNMGEFVFGVRYYFI
ncbi:MAG: outer membrane beta-barrel protein [Alphaproteobacteria bacterium]